MMIPRRRFNGANEVPERMKLFLGPNQLRAARRFGYIRDEPDGTMTVVNVPTFPPICGCQVIESKPLPQTGQ